MLVNSCPEPYGASREHARDGACAVAARTRLARIDTRGGALSSAILYLAIVAIWAVVLVPRWLRPRQAQRQLAEQQFVEQPAEPLKAPPAELLTAPPAEPLTAPPAEPLTVPPAGAERDEEAEPAPDKAPAGTQTGEPVPALPSPAARRAGMLQARRRILGMVVALTIGAVGLAVTGIAASWVVLPPAMLLAGFIVLLREAARSDAERTRRALRTHRAATAAVAGQEPVSFRGDVAARPYQEPAEPVPATAGAADAGSPPDAEVIDISARVSDQVYDQYADVAERAVGD
jgi:hypothetical protein